MNLLFKDLSPNPYAQYKVHMWGAIYWLINFPLICCLLAKAGLGGRRWDAHRPALGAGPR